MIEVQGLVKRYGSEQAVGGISFQVRTGEVLGFLGPNGAGKSSTMKVITGYLPPTEGTVLVDGMDVRGDTLAIKQRIGYLPEHTPLYEEMTVFDYLTFVAELRNVPASRIRERIGRMADVCGLGGVLSKPINALSKGYRQRVGLAQALIHDPPILILDEPTTGLDPNQIVEIRELIKAIGKEKTVILSTHILPEVQASCDRVLIIHRGHLVADGSPDELKAQFAGAQQLRFGAFAPVADLRTGIEALPGLRVVSADGNGSGESLLKLSSERTDDVRPELFRLAVEKGWTLTELVRDQANLEDVFRQLTSH